MFSEHRSFLTLEKNSGCQYVNRIMIRLIEPIQSFALVWHHWCMSLLSEKTITKQKIQLGAVFVEIFNLKASRTRHHSYVSVKCIAGLDLKRSIPKFSISNFSFLKLKTWAWCRRKSPVPSRQKWPKTNQVPKGALEIDTEKVSWGWLNFTLSLPPHR